MNLVEVALALPPFRVYTYRDPRRGEKLPLGAQVVVPLGPRRITGFVVGHPEQVPEGLKQDSDLKAIEDVLEDEPALDPEILELGRWAASYYLAPLGEVLRAALPQGERAAAVRRVRLTEEGKLFLKRDREGRGGLPALGLDQGDRDLLARLGRAPSLGRRGLAGTADERRLERFEEEGWVEVGDEVSGQTGGRRPLWAVPVADAPVPAWKPQQTLRRALYERVLAEPGGVALATLSPRERAGLRALARDGLVRIEARSPESDQAPLERPPELNPHQAAALQALTAALGERRLGDPERVPGPPRRDSGGEAASVPHRLGDPERVPGPPRRDSGGEAASVPHRIWDPERVPGPPRRDSGGEAASVPHRIWDPERVPGPPRRDSGGEAASVPHRIWDPERVPGPPRRDSGGEAASVPRVAAFVLHGVTGSGKTEVYLRLIAEARQRGRGALVLVPEIALTPQLAARFRARFGDDVAVLHSALPAAQRRAAWRRLRAGEVGIALGARSAVFAPVRQLGVVVVDEEHDPSFKQEDGLRYSGRDLALVRAQKSEAVAVLGSATPSLETFRNVEQGRYQRLLLPTRANPAAAARPLPPVEIIDLRRQPPMADGLFSKPLLQAMQATFQAGEQSILFLNRRGFSPLVLCRACGHVLRCTQCAVAMTFHQARALLACHYCGREEPVPRLCPSCHAPKLERLGTGTERVETLVREHFPTARVARLDRDSAGGRGGAVLERVLGQVHARAIDILVGTQMVTKGHDFEGVTLVGVLLPDQGMHMPDFRAAERTFQLLEQVAGRAGRGERPGRVLVQTYTPEHPAVAALPAHDYEGFARAELARRREASYPPFTRLIALRLEGSEGTDVRQAAGQAAARARAAGGEAVRVKGPAEAPIAVIRGLHRWQVWLAGTDRTALAAAARAAAGAASPGVRLVVDVDPQSVL